MTVLEKIDKLRKERGWSVNYLAMEAMITQSTLNNLYARNSEPKISTLRAICEAFGITLAQFFADGETEPRAEKENLDKELDAEIKSLTKAQKTALLAFIKTVNR